MDDFTAVSSVTLVNPLGLHARPSVKLTKLARTFASLIEIASAVDGPWVDAKSIVKVMAVKAVTGTTLQLRAKGPDASAALTALEALVVDGFPDDTTPRGEAEPSHG
ncbi:MAG: HPr family phosphocarrier protein [Roseiarcus sp.]|jgi:phosphocarrier protein